MSSNSSIARAITVRINKRIKLVGSIAVVRAGIGRRGASGSVSAMGAGMVAAMVFRVEDIIDLVLDLVDHTRHDEWRVLV